MANLRQSPTLLMAAAAAGALSVGAARAEDWNGYVTLTGTANDFEVLLKGNPLLNLSSVQTDPGINPFCWFEMKGGGTCGAATTPVTATSVDGGAYTLVTFSGPSLPADQSNIPGETAYHFGLEPLSGTGPWLQMVKEYWTNGTAKTVLPVLSSGKPPNATGTLTYVIFFANVAQGGVTTGGWWEVPYTLGTMQPSFAPINYSGAPETLSNVGFQLSNTEIPLDNLNYMDYPPPSPGSPGNWTPLPQYDGMLDPTMIPEPSTWAMLVAGFAGLGLAGWRRARPALSIA